MSAGIGKMGKEGWDGNEVGRLECAGRPMCRLPLKDALASSSTCWLAAHRGLPWAVHSSNLSYMRTSLERKIVIHGAGVACALQPLDGDVAAGGGAIEHHTLLREQGGMGVCRVTYACVKR